MCACSGRLTVCPSAPVQEGTLHMRPSGSTQRPRHTDKPPTGPISPSIRSDTNWKERVCLPSPNIVSGSFFSAWGQEGGIREQGGALTSSKSGSKTRYLHLGGSAQETASCHAPKLSLGCTQLEAAQPQSQPRPHNGTALLCKCRNARPHLRHKVGHDTAVVQRHAGAVGVEDAHDADLHMEATVHRHCGQMVRDKMRTMRTCTWGQQCTGRARLMRLMSRHCGQVARGKDARDADLGGGEAEQPPVCAACSGATGGGACPPATL